MDQSNQGGFSAEEIEVGDPVHNLIWTKIREKFISSIAQRVKPTHQSCRTADVFGRLLTKKEFPRQSKDAFTFNEHSGKPNVRE
jgi:hypothetical protein